MDTYHRWMEVVIGGTLPGVPVLNVPAAGLTPLFLFSKAKPSVCKTGRYVDVNGGSGCLNEEQVEADRPAVHAPQVKPLIAAKRG